jgi:hypothetical protein
MRRVSHSPTLRRNRRRSGIRWLVLSAVVHAAVIALLALVADPGDFSAVSAIVEVEIVKQNDRGKPSQSGAARRSHTLATSNKKNPHRRARRESSAAAHPGVGATVTTRKPHRLPPPPRKTARKTSAKPSSGQRLPWQRNSRWRFGQRAKIARQNASAKATEKTRAVDHAPPAAAKAAEPKVSCLLSMRGCAESKQPSRSKPDRFASFRARGKRRPQRKAANKPRVVARVSHNGLQISRYRDGGRLLRALSNRTRAPGHGEIGLLTLASSPIGSSIGRRACDVYRNRVTRGVRRSLVLLVDTSGSITARKKAPAAIVCAAGAALSALARGYTVTIANFSSNVWYLRRSRDHDAIYSVLSRLQGQKTRLPPASLFPLYAKLPRDFVLVTDTGIDNLKRVLPGYELLVRSNAQKPRAPVRAGRWQ